MTKSALLCCVWSFAACAPELPTDTGVISTPRVIAVKGEPAESKPGSTVIYSALLAAPAGTESVPAPAWDFCVAPKPPTENNAVSDACLGQGALVRAGAGDAITATTPESACSLFGPDTPPGGFRPRDPDVTGGYYQPLRVSLAGAGPSFALERLRCDLGSASADIASAFAAAYVPNANPTLLPLTADAGGQETPLASVARGTRVTLRASWAPEDAESYAYYDRDTQSLTTKREAMRVVWYATAGRFDATTTGRDESDAASDTTNGWTAPVVTGAAVLWVVLQDSRGGVDFARYDVNVTP